MTRTSAFKAALLSSLALGALTAGPAAADPAATTAAETANAEADTTATMSEVIVTARRQNERAGDVPIPLSVVPGDVLEKTGTYTLADVQRLTPSLTALQPNARNASVSIRGIGASSASDGLDTSVGVYVDGVYLGRPGMALADLIDVDQFEVLRGPQGTLFGRNSSAGVLNITTRQPTFVPSATVEASYGNYNYTQLKAVLNGPLVDGVLAYRLSVFDTRRDGVLDNIKTGGDANSVGRAGARLQFLATPSDKLSIRLIGEYSKENDTCCVSVLTQVLPGGLAATTRRTLTSFAALGYVPTASTDYTQNNAPQNMLTDQHALSAEIRYDLGWADLTSISAYRYWRFHPLQDSDSTPLDIIQVNVAQTKDWQYSQEVRLASKPGRLNWQTGAYLFKQKLKDHFILNQFGSDAGAFYTTFLRTATPTAAAVSIAPGSQYIGDTLANSESAAVFGQANFNVTDRFILTGGLRYTHDKRTGISDTSTVGTPYAATSIPFHYNVVVKGGNLSYLGSASYKFAKDSLAYVSYSTGYKSAGLNLNAAVTAGSPLIVRPEKTRNWELGLKQSLFDGRANLNLSAFRTELSGLQSNIFPSNGARSYLANVGDILSKGLEAEGSLQIVDGLVVSLNGAYDDAKYTSYPNAPCPVGAAAPCDLTGRPVFQVPKYIANATAQYQFDLNDKVQPYAYLQYSYRSAVYATVEDSPFIRIPAYSLVNARLGAKLAGGKYDVSLWVNNLFDKDYYSTLAQASIVGAGVWGVAGQLGAPRTVGATVRAEF